MDIKKINTHTHRNIKNTNAHKNYSRRQGNFQNNDFVCGLMNIVFISGEMQNWLDDICIFSLVREKTRLQTENYYVTPLYRSLSLWSHTHINTDLPLQKSSLLILLVVENRTKIFFRFSAGQEIS